MPGSAIQGKAEIQKWFESQKNIKTVIDVGAGSGTYPKLIGGVSKKWIGIEIWAPYIKQFELERLYNEIVIGDILYVNLQYLLESNKKENVVILGDVLEHLDKEDGIFVLKKTLAIADHVIVSLPVDDRPSAEHYGNHFEGHKAGFSFLEIAEIAEWEIAIQSRGIGVFIK